MRFSNTPTTRLFAHPVASVKESEMRRNLGHPESVRAMTDLRFRRFL